MKSRNGTFLAALAALAMLASACGSGGSGASSGGSDGGGSDGGGGGDPVTIGATFPLTGSSASPGQNALNGVELAIEVVNNEHPELIGLPLAETAGLPNLDNRTVSVESADHAGDPQTGASETERLINDKEVVGMVGAYFSSVTKTASEVAEDSQIPFVNGASSSSALTNDEDRAALEYFFRTGPSDETFADTFFKAIEDLEARDGIELRKIALLYENTDFGSDMAEVATALANANGFEIVADVKHGKDVADVSSEAQKIIAADPDIIFQASSTPEAALFTKAWSAKDYAAPIFAFGAGFSDTKLYEDIGSKGDFTILRAAWELTSVSDKPSAVGVADMYEQKFGTPMDENSARTFTAALVLLNAINEAGSTEPEAIKEALEATELDKDQTIMPWNGVKFAENGQNELAQGVVLQRIDGVNEVVWPFETAQAELQWPVPPVSNR